MDGLVESAMITLHNFVHQVLDGVSLLPKFSQSYLWIPAGQDSHHMRKAIKSLLLQHCIEVAKLVIDILLQHCGLEDAT